MSNHSGVGSALSAAEVQAQRVEDKRAAADAEALAHDREVAAAEAARTIDIWEARMRGRIEALLIDLAERKHHDANRQQWYDSLRVALADTKTGLFE